MIQFQRNARLQVGRPGSKEGKEFKTALRFVIEKDEYSVSNKAKIAIYNLSKSSASWLEDPANIVRLFCGYGTYDEQVFIGDLIPPIKTERDGANLVTVIECGDAELALKSSKIDISLKKGQSLSELIPLAREALGVGLGPLRGDLTKPISRAYTFSGTVRDMLNEITSDLGLVWSIQDMELQIYPKDDHIRTQAIVLDSNTGLFDGLSKSQNLIVGKCLLNPKIRPGRIVHIKSKIFSNIVNSAGGKNGEGFFKVTKVRISGETNGNVWESEFQGEAVNATAKL